MIFIVLSLVVPTTATSFLQQVDTQAEVEASLMAEFAGTFRPGAKQDNILQHEAALRPMYSVVPQEADGTLQHTVVRYVLHRFFAQRGWFIRGLEPGTGAQSGISGNHPQGLQEWVPTFLQNFLDKIGGRGIGLRELAILAATLEDLVHKETLGRLEKAFHALELHHSAELNQEQIQEVLEVFMMLYQEDGPNLDTSSPAAVRKEHIWFTQNVEDWTGVQKWMLGVQQKVHPTKATLDFNALSAVAEEIGATYGTYNKKTCGTLKAALLNIESQKAGRVRLSDFYEVGRTGTFGFSEKVDYLRVLGALDETDPNQLHVIVPNYVSSRPNCLAASELYAICCSNECEDLMTKLESSIAAETALPGQIIHLVSDLSTETVVAPRKLSPTLVRRLESIAQSNSGQVPLHGRLFAQWMHHAFPRECPFPHQGGSTNPQTPDEWMQASGHATSKATEEEMNAHVGRDTEAKPKGAEAREHHHLEQHDLQWSESEELLLPLGGSTRSKPRSFLHTFAVFVVLCSMASGVVWASKSPVLLDSLLHGLGFDGKKPSLNMGLPMYDDLANHAGKMA